MSGVSPIDLSPVPRRPTRRLLGQRLRRIAAWVHLAFALGIVVAVFAQTGDRVSGVSPRREGHHAGRIAIRPDGFAAEALERVANKADNFAGWLSPGSEAIDGPAGDAGDLGESYLRNHPESREDQLRVDPPARVSERVGHVINCDETCRQVFDFVRFLSDVADRDVANWPTLEQPPGFAAAGSAIGAEALGFALPAVEGDDVADALDANSVSPTEAAGGDSVRLTGARRRPIPWPSSGPGRVRKVRRGRTVSRPRARVRQGG